MTYTILHRNGLAAHLSKFQGTFASELEAEVAMQGHASRMRKFVELEIWTGTPRNPGKPTGKKAKGTQ